MALTNAERAALDRLIAPEQQTGNVTADLIAAAKEAWRRRQQNSIDGGAVLAALHRDAASWRALAWATGIPSSTARRWASTPGATDAELDELTNEPEDE